MLCKSNINVLYSACNALNDFYAPLTFIGLTVIPCLMFKYSSYINVLFRIILIIYLLKVCFVFVICDFIYGAFCLSLPYSSISCFMYILYCDVKSSAAVQTAFTENC